jgi:signal transduction histidine kinase/CheY-like chemotaxis protein
MTHTGLRDRALILAPIGRDTAVAAGVLDQIGITSVVCRDLAELITGLELGAGTAIVTVEALRREPLEPLTDWLDAQPAWSDFPFVMLTGAGSVAPTATGLTLMGLLRNVTLLERPVRAVTLASAAQAALRARRRQYEVEAHLHERELNETVLRGLNETLEQRVAERTLRLEETNQRLLQEMEERERTEEALRQAQKMQAVGQLTGGIAHDFNNVLTAISGNLELLEESLRANPELHRLASGAARGVERASKLTQQLLAFSRKQHLEPQPTDFNGIVIGMAELLSRTCGETLTIDQRLAGELWPALTDPHQLESALLNLVINARDATPDGGHITITTHNAAVDRAMGLEIGLSPGNYVLLSVGDTGCGMNPEVLARVFEPFFTTKPIGKGSGLGLSMVYGFVRQSNGHVRIDSQEGKGTTVHLYLPRADGAAAPDTARDGAGELRGEAPAALKILVVEDAGDVREIAVMVLRKGGYTVLEAPDAATALDMLARDPEIALVFTDVVMPGTMNGIDLARTVVERWPTLRLILTSGYAERLTEREWLPPDVGFLRKPYRPLELIGKVRAAVQSGAARLH